MNHAYRRYVPALGFGFLTPFYVRGALILAGALGAASFAAHGDEAEIRRVISSKLRGFAIESVRPGPAGLFEVVVRAGGEARVLYADPKATVIIDGSVIDARSGRNLTEERLRKLSAIEWSELPLQWAITMTRGTGRRKIAIFSDPNCPYCKRLEEDLMKLDDITVHILPYAIIAPQSVRQSKAVWCSKDRIKAWNDLMFRRIEPQAAPDCDTPVEKLIEYGRRLGATATPTWFLANGQRFSGALPLDEVRRLLDEASAARR